MCQCAEQVTAKMEAITAESQALSDEPLVRVLYDGETVPVARHEVVGVQSRKSYGRREKGDVFLIYSKDFSADRFKQLA